MQLFFSINNEKWRFCAEILVKLIAVNGKNHCSVSFENASGAFENHNF